MVRLIKIHHITAILILLCAILLQGCAFNNYGFPGGFSVEKMDKTADPKSNFNQYAAGKWLDSAKEDSRAFVSSRTLIENQVFNQLNDIVREASKHSTTARKGSPLQQIGDFYKSGMNTSRLKQLGVTPLKPYFDEIANSNDSKSLAKTLANMELMTNSFVLIGAEVDADVYEPKNNAVYFHVNVGLGRLSHLTPKEVQAAHDAYKKLMVRFFTLSGETPEEAEKNASIALAMEIRIADKKMSPEDNQDFSKRFTRMSFSELQSLIPNIDLATYFTTLGLPKDRFVNATELEALKEINIILGEYSYAEIQAYLRWALLIRKYTFLDPTFIEAVRDVSGKRGVLSKSTLVLISTINAFQQEVSKLYVEKHFSVEAKRAAEDLAKRIKTELNLRLLSASWLSDKSRRHAVDKLNNINVYVGYPDEWLNHSRVDIRVDDYLGNIFRIGRFDSLRALKKYDKPSIPQLFNLPGKSLPFNINASYFPMYNNVQITAAILQSPFYDVKADPALNFCGIGAVIGHELTHAFDPQGRQFDSDSKLGKWWTDDEIQYYQDETKKLIAHANAHKATPDLSLNGQLSVGENLADIGGISLAYSALKTYLREHPEDNKLIDGLTQDQRCFINWAQIWADKSDSGFLKKKIANDPHSIGDYRMLAPLQHIGAFYEAFGIRESDPVWLEEKQRINLW